MNRTVSFNKDKKYFKNLHTFYHKKDTIFIFFNLQKLNYICILY